MAFTATAFMICIMVCSATTFMVFFFLLVVVIGLILSLGAIMQESFAMRKFPKISHVLTLTAYAVLDNFGFRQFNTVIRFIGFLKYRKGKDSWGAMKRKQFSADTGKK